MTDETVPAANSVGQPALDAALAAALRPPRTPSDLQAGVLAAIAREGPIDSRAARQELEQQYRAAIASLNQFYVRRCRDALLLGSGLLAAVGFGVEPLSQGLAPLLAGAAPMAAGATMLIVGATCGAALMRELFVEHLYIRQTRARGP
jgi:hypothetical protein